MNTYRVEFAAAAGNISSIANGISTFLDDFPKFDIAACTCDDAPYNGDTASMGCMLLFLTKSACLQDEYWNV